jgi:hypothetical protein
MRYEIREMEVGGILDQAIKITKDHFWLFLKISAVLLVPFSIITGLLVLWNMPDVPTLSQARMYAAGGQYAASPSLMSIISITTLINLVIVYPLTDAALIYAIANCYLEKPIGVGPAFRRAGRIIFPLIGTWILTYLVIVLGLVLLIIPGIIFALWFSLISRVVVIEGVSGTTAMSRSKTLMKGNIGTAMAVGFVVFIISLLINWAPRLIPQAELRVVIYSILQAIVSFFIAAAWVVFYFSCRCKVENFDLTVLADSVAAEDSPATA